MKTISFSNRVRLVVLFVFLLSIAVSCTPVIPYMAMNPPPDSDKPFPVPAGDNSCWMHTAANVLAGAGYGNGTTVQDRADDIFADLDTQYGVAYGGWADSAITWWLASANNTWTSNPYTVVTVYGNKTKIPWANSNGARDIANELRSGNRVGLSISWPTGSGGSGGHAITAWGDNFSSSSALTVNPGQIRLTDSDNENSTGGDVQVYTYDSYTSPNPGGANEGNGWYFDYGANHPFIKHIVTLSPTMGAYGVNTVHVEGSYQIEQTSKQEATDLHYTVSTDVEILSYRTWLDVSGTPTITEATPRKSITVDWIFDKPIPQGNTVTITTEFIEPSWNKIGYSDVYFTYPEGKSFFLPDLEWEIVTPAIEKAESIPYVTGGYVIGSFDVYDPKNPDAGTIHYRLVHEYLYNQNPELHTFMITGTPGVIVSNFVFGHSYGYPTEAQLWEFQDWMMKDGERYILGDKPVEITIDWKGMLPYPEGDMGD